MEKETGDVRMKPRRICAVCKEPIKHKRRTCSKKRCVVIYARVYKVIQERIRYKKKKAEEGKE